MVRGLVLVMLVLGAVVAVLRASAPSEALLERVLDAEDAYERRQYAERLR